MKRLISLLLTAVMLLSLTACGSKSEAPDEGEAGTEEVSYEVTEPITIQFWHNYSNEMRAKWLDDVAKKFSESQEYITVECSYIGGYPTIAEQVAGALAAGSGLPALSMINVPRVLNWADSGVIEPLDGYLENMDFDADDFFEGMLNSVATEDGTTYALPFGISAGVCIYNKTLLDELNLPFPETWEDFKTWCKDVYEATGKCAFAFPYDFNYMNTFFLNVTGIDPLGDGTKSALDDERVITFVKELKELVDAGYCCWMGAKINAAQDDQMAAFALQEIAAYTDTSSGVMKVMDSVDFEVGTAIGVSGTDAPAITTSSGAALVVFADNDQAVKTAAMQFAAYLTNAENAAAWAADTCMFPVRKSSVDSGVLQATYEKYPGVKTIFSEAANIIGKNKSPAMQTCLEIVVGTLGDYLKGNVSDFDSAWATMQKEVDIELADS